MVMIVCLWPPTTYKDLVSAKSAVKAFTSSRLQSREQTLCNYVSQTIKTSSVVLAHIRTSKRIAALKANVDWKIQNKKLPIISTLECRLCEAFLQALNTQENGNK